MVDYETFQKEWDEAVGEDAAREFEQWKRCSEMLRQLQILRIDSGRTEEDIANILGWTEEQVLTFYAYNQLVTNRTVELVAMFSNQSAVTEALEKILPPEFRPSRSTKKSNTGLSDYETPFVAGEVVLNSPSG